MSINGTMCANPHRGCSVCGVGRGVLGVLLYNGRLRSPYSTAVSLSKTGVTSGGEKMPLYNTRPGLCCQHTPTVSTHHYLQSHIGILYKHRIHSVYAHDGFIRSTARIRRGAPSRLRHHHHNKETGIHGPLHETQNTPPPPPPLLLLLTRPLSSAIVDGRQGCLQSPAAIQHATYGPISTVYPVRDPYNAINMTAMSSFTYTGTRGRRGAGTQEA